MTRISALTLFTVLLTPTPLFGQDVSAPIPIVKEEMEVHPILFAMSQFAEKLDEAQEKLPEDSPHRTTTAHVTQFFEIVTAINCENEEAQYLHSHFLLQKEHLYLGMLQM